MSYLRYLCLFAYSGVQHILCCVVLCFCFVCLRLVHHMLPIFLDCPFLIADSLTFISCTNEIGCNARVCGFTGLSK